MDVGDDVGVDVGLDVVDVRDAFCLYPVPGGSVAALRGLTLAVRPGERVVVHGPNGSGKTTLLRVLAGEQRLSAGRAVVAGMDVGAVGADRGGALARWRNQRLGWVDQHPVRTLRPELAVLDNVALQQRLGGVPADAAREAALATLASLGVRQLADRQVTGLSGGEAQRVAVAAALAHGPRLVLADEPSGELDARSADQVYDALAGSVHAAGAALVLVSHDRRAARVADRVVRIRDGRLSETWEPGGEERLVVDDRGWLRLPDTVRSWAGAGARDHALHVERSGDAILLRPVTPVTPGSPATPVPAATAVPPGTPASPTIPVPATAEAAGPVPAIARLRGVDKAYGDRAVLAGVDLDVPPGELTVVRGRSGAGKSTLLRVLTGLERPDAGSVRLDGTDLAGLDRSQLALLRRRAVAFVGQEIHLAETSDVLANLAFARALRGLPADREADRRRLADLDLGHLERRLVRLLSGGERQRVALARALVVGARLVVLDEPSSQVDEGSAERLAQVLVRAAREGTAVLVASHDPVLVAAADRVVDVEPAPGEHPGAAPSAGPVPGTEPAAGPAGPSPEGLRPGSQPSARVGGVTGG